MKFKALARSAKKCTRELATDARVRPRNASAEVHPFAQPREYRRALNATKLERVFAKPFMGALDGHTDGVWCSASPHSSLVQFISGACDGEVRVWDLASRKCVWSIAAHRGIVKGVSVAPSGADFFVTAGDDSQVKLWGINKSASSSSSYPTSVSNSVASPVLSGAGLPFKGIANVMAVPRAGTLVKPGVDSQDDGGVMKDRGVDSVIEEEESEPDENDPSLPPWKRALMAARRTQSAAKAFKKGLTGRGATSSASGGQGVMTVQDAAQAIADDRRWVSKHKQRSDALNERSSPTSKIHSHSISQKS